MQTRTPVLPRVTVLLAAAAAFFHVVLTSAAPAPKITTAPTPSATATATATPTATPFSVVVTTTADTGPGSLRQAIADASDGDTILFDPVLSGQTIVLSVQLVLDKSISIIGPGSGLLTVSRTGFFDRLFYIAPSHVVSLRGLTIKDGLNSNDPVGGGAIFNDRSSLTLNDCVVTDNRCACVRGAGIYNGGKNAVLTIINSVVTINIGSEDGGGIYNDGTLIVRQSVIAHNNSAGRGGGIFSEGNMEVTDSTISENRGDVAGGGISNTGSSTITNTTISDNLAYNRGSGIENAGPLAVINSTISGNGRGLKVTVDPGDGGGVYNADAVVMITHTTISENISGRFGAGGGIYLASGTLQIDQTILNRGKTGANIVNDSGTITSNGYNLSSDNGGGFLNGPGDLVNTTPLLGPLQNNGGPTYTHALLNESLAIDAGNPGLTPSPSYDQRGAGFIRVYNTRADIGSFEAQPPAAQPAGMLNISTRLRVETDDGIMIGGFIISGSEPKRVAIRGTGPSLNGSGVSDPLVDPSLELRDSDGAILGQNDNWQSNPSQAAELGSLGLALQNYFESGMVVTLQPGAYTAFLTGRNRMSGVGLIEVYDINPTATSRLANLSTRGLVQTDSDVMIGGFLLGNGRSMYGLAVRGIGPSLAQTGLNNVLADPTLELRDSNGVLLIANDNWQDDSVSAAQLMTLGLAPQDSLESAIVTNLANGAFTAILSGKDAGIGIGVVEFYDVPPQAEQTPTPGPTSTPATN